MNRFLYIGRQPVFDAEGKISFYELFYREGDDNLSPSSDSKATAKVLNNVLNYIGIQNLLEKGRFFINVSPELLSNNHLIEVISKDNFILEVKSSWEFDDDLLQQLMSLNKQGYKLSLDNCVCDEESLLRLEPVFEIVDFLKVDMTNVDMEYLARYISFCKEKKLTLVAEKLETNELKDFSERLGFQYFQGYFYQEPSVEKVQNLTPIARTILNLIRLIETNAELEEITEEIKTNPEVAINLLQYVNSAAFSFQKEISSISQAVVKVGRANLKQWLMLFVFLDSESHAHTEALMESALIRGKLVQQSMLLLNEDKGDIAYMTGLISVLDALFDVPMELLLKESQFDAEVNDALIKHAGRLGQLLSLAIHAEKEDFGPVYEQLQVLKIDVRKYMNLLKEAYLWADITIKKSKQGPVK